MIKYEKDTSGLVILTMDMSNRSINIINHEIGKAFIPVLEQLRKEHKEGTLKGVIIASAKETFLAGGDLDYLYQTREPKEIFRFVEIQKELFRALETLGVPIVAAINGAALGSGFELTLACHYRIALNNPKTLIGLPEVTLGLMPGSGGTIRLLWLLGLESAFQFITSGQKLTIEEALEKKLIDAIVNTPEEILEQAEAWIDANPNYQQIWDKNKKAPPFPLTTKINRIIASLSAKLTKETFNNYPAPRAILNTLVEGLNLDFETATRIESRHFTSLLTGNTAHNMIKAFWYDFNKIKSGASRPKGYGRFRPKRIGIIGAGTMGSGIAYVAAIAGLEVVLKDISKSVAQRGKQLIEKIIDKEIDAGKIQMNQKQPILERIITTEHAVDFKQCDLIIEAVFENQALKGKVTKEAEQFLDSYAIFASNTSTLSITGLAKQCERPENFIGLHFFSPANKMPLVEIITGEQTSDETLARAFDFVKCIGKTPIVVKDSWGFYTTRVISRYILEGLTLLLDGQSPIAIERASLQAGMPRGPLALIDDLSLSFILNIEEQIKTEQGEAYQKPPGIIVIEKMINEWNRLGRAKGNGFYEYPKGKQKHLWQELSVHFPNKTPLPITTIQERLMFVQAIEAARAYEEKVISNVSDANIGSIYGWNFAPFKGGVLQYINDYGIDTFIHQSDRFVEEFGKQFSIPESLRAMAVKAEVY